MNYQRNYTEMLETLEKGIMTEEEQIDWENRPQKGCILRDIG
jgi:hypothetical protein